MNQIYKKNLWPLFNKCIIICLLMLGTSVVAQRETAIWYYGIHGGLDFNSGSPVFLTDGQLNESEGCAAVSTREGSLLFYTDGQQVFNRNHIQMQTAAGC